MWYKIAQANDIKIETKSKGQNHRSFFVVLDGKDIGGGELYFTDNEIRTIGFGLDKEYQNQGYGTIAYQKLYEYIKNEMPWITYVRSVTMNPVIYHMRQKYFGDFYKDDMGSNELLPPNELAEMDARFKQYPQPGQYSNKAYYLRNKINRDEEPTSPYTPPESAQ